MAVTLYIKDGRKFNIEDLRDVLPSCKLAVDYASLEQQLATLRAERDALREATELANAKISNYHLECHTLRAERDVLMAENEVLMSNGIKIMSNNTALRADNERLRDALRLAADEPNIDRARAIADKELGGGGGGA